MDAYERIRKYQSGELLPARTGYAYLDKALLGGFVAKELSNAYNSGCVSIYEAKDKTLRYSVYRDGCFYPYYGKLEVVE